MIWLKKNIIIYNFQLVNQSIIYSELFFKGRKLKLNPARALKIVFIRYCL